MPSFLHPHSSDYYTSNQTNPGVSQARPGGSAHLPVMLVQGRLAGACETQGHACQLSNSSMASRTSNISYAYQWWEITIPPDF